MGATLGKLIYKCSGRKVRAQLLLEDYIDLVSTYQDVLAEDYDIPLEFVTEMCEAFVLFDKDRNGYICSNELGNVMRTMGRNPTEKKVRFIHNLWLEITFKYNR